MPGVRARRFEFAVTVSPDGEADGDGLAPLERRQGWTPEHLVLVALVRCSLTSLAYHARRSGAAASGGGTAAGTVTKREEDGRFAFVDVSCRLDVRIEPLPEPDALAKLLAAAERDCFIGASLT